MPKYRLPASAWSLFLILLLFILGACNQQGNQGTPPPPPPPPSPQSGIDGYLVAANAGAPVDGATIKVYKSGTSSLVTTVTTDAEGAFHADLAAGSYDLVASKPGYAGSQVLNVRVADGKRTPLAFIERKAFNPSWPTDPPQVNVEKVTDGAVYDGLHGYVPYRIRVTPAAPLKTQLIYAALGKTPGSGFLTAPRAFFDSVDDTGDRYLDPFTYAVVGPTTFQAVAYDTNGNRTQVFRYIDISIPSISGVDLVPPLLRFALAVTLNKGLDFFSLRPQAAPAGGNLYVELAWEPKYDFSHADNDAPYGYRIYRSFDGQNFTPIATVNGYTNRYLDASPELAPGKKAYYRVTAFIGNQESAPSNVLATTPLEPFDVHLTVPADNAQNVSTTPTFEWTTTQAVGAHQYYAGALWDTLTGEDAFFTNNAQFTLVDRTSWTWNEDGAFDGTNWEVLQKGRSYEWQIIEAYALDDPVHPTAVSVAADGLGLWSFGVPSTNHFTFTTAP